MAQLIQLVEFIEHAQWDESVVTMETLGLTKEQVIKDYNDAISWADEQSQLCIVNNVSKL